MDSQFMIAVPHSSATTEIGAIVSGDEISVPITPVRASLLRSMSWSFVGNVVDIGCSWAFLTILVKLGTTAMVGQYGLAMAFLGPIFALSSMQMRALQATDARHQFTFGVYFVTRLLTIVVALVALGAVLVVNREDPFMVVLSLVMFARLAALSIQEVYFGFLQQHEWIERMAQVQMVASAALVGSFTVGLVLTDSLIGATIVSTIAVIGATLLCCIPVASRMQRTRPVLNGLALDWNRHSITGLLASAAPLGVVSFLISMRASVPRLFLDRYTNETQLGVFVALTAILTAGVALTASVSQAAIPRMAWLRAEDDRQGFIRLLMRLEIGSFGVLIASVVGAWFLGPFTIRIIYSSEYAEYQPALMWLAAACGVSLMSIYFGNAITVARRLKIQVFNNIVTLGIMLGLCQLLVPRYGVTGAAAAIAFAGVVSLTLNVLVCLRFLRNWAASENNLESTGA